MTLLNLTRRPDWDRRMNHVVETHMALPGQWGRSDCWIMTMDAIEAVTGQRILPDLQRYRTEGGGYRAFHRAGFRTVEEALASVLAPVGRLMAQRGDVATVERHGVISCGVVTSEGLAVKTLYGEPRSDVERAALDFLPVTMIRQAFRLGRA